MTRLRLIGFLCVVCFLYIAPIYAESVPATTQEQTSPVRVTLFPAEMGRNNILPCISESVSPALFQFAGEAKLLGKKVELVLDLPKGFAVYSNSSSPVSSMQKDNRVIAAVDISATAMKMPTISSNSSATELIWLETSMPATDQEVIRFHIASDGKEYSKKQLKLRVLPPFVDGPRAKFMMGYTWSLYNGIPEPLYAKVYEMYRKSGINAFMIRPQAYEKQPPDVQYMEKQFKADGAKLYATVPGSYYERLPEQYKDRYRAPNAFTHFVSDGETAFDRIDNGCLESCKDRIDFYFWDFERYDVDSHPCHDDPETMKQFAQWSGRDASNLTPEDIKEKCWDEFMAFRDWQYGETIRTFEKWVRRHNPNLTVLIAAAGVKLGHGYVDYRMWQDANVIEQPMLYCSLEDYEKHLARHMRLSKGKPFAPYVTNQGNISESLPPLLSPQTMRQLFILSAALGTVGVYHWPDLHRCGDAEYLWYQGLASHELSMVEDFYADGIRVDENIEIKGLPEKTETIPLGRRKLVLETPQWNTYLSTYCHKKGLDTLVTILNRNTEKDAFVRISLPLYPRERYSVCNAIRKERYITNNGSSFWWQGDFEKGILIQVPAGDVRFVRISPRKFPFETKGQIDTSETEKAYQTACRQAAKSKSATILRKDGVEIGYDDRHEDGDVQIAVTTPAQKVWFDTIGGKIVGWSVNKAEWIEPAKDSGLAIDQFWWPLAARAGQDYMGQYEVTDRAIIDNMARITMRRTLSNGALQGFEIKKTFHVHAGKPQIDVDVDIRATSVLQPQEFSYWSHNEFDTRGVQAGYCYQGTEGLVSLKPDMQFSTLVVGLPDEQKVPDADRQRFPSATEGWMDLVAPLNKGRVHITTEFADLAQIYRWTGGAGGGHQTMEWMYRKVTLNTGESWHTKFSYTYQP